MDGPSVLTSQDPMLKELQRRDRQNGRAGRGGKLWNADFWVWHSCRIHQISLVVVI